MSFRKLCNNIKPCLLSHCKYDILYIQYNYFCWNFYNHASKKQNRFASFVECLLFFDWEFLKHRVVIEKQTMPFLLILFTTGKKVNELCSSSG